MHARYYTPELGRFLSVDPERSGVGDPPQAYNRYAYALDNPVTLTDPEGEDVVYLGVEGGYALLSGFRFEGGVIVDTSGSVGLYGSAGINLGLYLNGGPLVGYSTVDTIEDFEGVSVNLDVETPGVSVGVHGTGPGDPDGTGEQSGLTDFGGDVGPGFGAGLGSVSVNGQKVKPLFNVVDVAKDIYDKTEEVRDAIMRFVENPRKFFSIPLDEADDPDPERHRD
jgi:hypothetical protein